MQYIVVNFCKNSSFFNDFGHFWRVLCTKKAPESAFFTFLLVVNYLTTTGSYFGTSAFITLQPMR